MDGRAKINNIWIVVIIHLALYISPFTHAEEEYVSFKLVFEQEVIGSIETIYRPEGIYVNLPRIMETLGYACEYKAGEKRFSTCCPDRSKCFHLLSDTLFIGTEEHILPDSLLILTTEEIYIRSDYFSHLCEINLEIIFQSFKIDITSSHTLPIEVLHNQEVRQRAFRANIEKSNSGLIDTIPLRKAYLNSIKYELSGSFSGEGIEGYDAVAGGNSELLGGSLNLNYAFSRYGDIRRQEFNFKQMYEFNNHWIRQLSVFRQNSCILMSGLEGDINGIYISNDDASFFNRRYYLYRSVTRPETTVEIYSNGTLVSLVTTDSLGHFETMVPVTDGINLLSAVTVDGYGSTVVDEQSVYISQDLLPRKQFRYQFSTGVSDSKEYFTGVIAEYGVTSSLTLSSRAELVIKDRHTALLAGVGLKYSFRTWLQIGADYLPFVKHKLYLTGNTAWRLGYSLIYEDYRKGQRLLPNAPLSDFRVNVSYVLPFLKTQHNVTFSLRDLHHRSGNTFSSAIRFNMFWRNYLLSGDISTVSRKSFSLGKVSYSARVGYKINNKFYNELHYDYNASVNEHTLRERLQFKLLHNLQGNCMVSYQVRNHYVGVELGVTCRLPRITLKGGSRAFFPGWSVNTGIEGSVQFYPNHNLDWNNRSSSNASLHVAVFADTNGNLVYDKGETIIPEAKVLVKTGAEEIRKPSGIYFRNIAPGHAFKINIPRQPLRDISWQITPIEKILYLSSGQSHSLYIPVQIISEVSGEVFTREGEKRKPLKKKVVELVRQGDNYVVREYTDNWGTYYFTGLTAGTYSMRVSSGNSSDLVLYPHTIIIPPGEEGIQMEHVDLDLTPEN